MFSSFLFSVFCFIIFFPCASVASVVEELSSSTSGPTPLEPKSEAKLYDLDDNLVNYRLIVSDHCGVRLPSQFDIKNFDIYKNDFGDLFFVHETKGSLDKDGDTFFVINLKNPTGNDNLSRKQFEERNLELAQHLRNDRLAFKDVKNPTWTTIDLERKSESEEKKFCFSCGQIRTFDRDEAFVAMKISKQDMKKHRLADRFTNNKTNWCKPFLCSPNELLMLSSGYPIFREYISAYEKENKLGQQTIVYLGATEKKEKEGQKGENKEMEQASKPDNDDGKQAIAVAEAYISVQGIHFHDILISGYEYFQCARLNQNQFFLIGKSTASAELVIDKLTIVKDY